MHRRGTTLLVIVLVLGFALAASLGATTLLLGEISQTRLITDSVITFSATDAGIEQALYHICKLNDRTDQLTPQPVGDGAYTYRISPSAGPNMRLYATGVYKQSQRQIQVTGFTDQGSRVECVAGGIPAYALAQWKMDETANGTCQPGNKDVCDTAGGNHGTASGATIVAGLVGNARSFSGSLQYVDGNGVAVDGLSSITVIAWFKTTATQPNQYLVSLPSAPDGTPGIDLKIVGAGTVGADVRTSAGTVSLSSSTTYVDGNWHQIVVVFNGTRAMLYYDGLSTGVWQGVSGTIEASANGEFNLGRSGSFGGYYNGQLDEVSVDAVALSDIEVCGSYKAVSGRASCGTPAPSSVASWPLNEAVPTGTCVPSGKDACETVGSRDGTATGTTVAAGISGNARSFNGLASGDQISVPHDDIFNSTASFSAALWKKPAWESEFRTDLYKCSNATCSQYNWRLGMDFTWASFYIANAGGATYAISCPYSALAGYTSFADGRWHYVVGTYEQSTAQMRLYVDGRACGGPVTVVGAHRTGSYPLGIGGVPAGGLSEDWYMRGTLDEVALYNFTLSSTQICNRFKALTGRASCPY